MDAVAILTDAFDRVRGSATRAVDGLDLDALTWQPDDAANTIALSFAWHLARVQDDHVADVAGTEQVWVEGDWADRFGLPRRGRARPASATGPRRSGPCAPPTPTRWWPTSTR